MIVGTGIDIAEVPRIRQSIERFGDRFLQRIFTAAKSSIATQGKPRGALCRALRRQRSGHEGSGHGLEPWRPLAGLRSHAPARRASDHHFSRKGRRVCRQAGREARRTFAFAHGGTSHRASHSRKLKVTEHRTSARPSARLAHSISSCLRPFRLSRRFLPPPRSPNALFWPVWGSPVLPRCCWSWRSPDCSPWCSSTTSRFLRFRLRCWDSAPEEFSPIC